GACRLLGILEDRPDQPPGPASAVDRGCDRSGGGAASRQRRQFAPLGGGPAASGALDTVRGGYLHVPADGAIPVRRQLFVCKILGERKLFSRMTVHRKRIFAKRLA